EAAAPAHSRMQDGASFLDHRGKTHARSPLGDLPESGAPARLGSLRHVIRTADAEIERLQSPVGRDEPPSGFRAHAPEALLILRVAVLGETLVVMDVRERERGAQIS